MVLPSYSTKATPGGIRETAIMAEGLGFDSVWTTDHLMVASDTQPVAAAFTDGFPYRSIFEAINTLSWIAGFTASVRLGISVLILPQRHPVSVAKEIATLDALSGGRCILGLGLGWVREEFEYLNADYRNRAAFFEEGVRVLRTLWTSPLQPFVGNYYNFAGHAFAPPPLQAGGPPLWIGGNSAAAVRRAAAFGDAWHPATISPLLFDELGQMLQELTARKVDLTLRAVVRAIGGLRETPRGPVYVLGSSSSEMSMDIAKFSAAGCCYICLDFWDRDLDTQYAVMKRFAAEVMPQFSV